MRENRETREQRDKKRLNAKLGVLLTAAGIGIPVGLIVNGLIYYFSSRDEDYRTILFFMLYCGISCLVMAVISSICISRYLETEIQLGEFPIDTYRKEQHMLINFYPNIRALQVVLTAIIVGVQSLFFSGGFANLIFKDYEVTVLGGALLAGACAGLANVCAAYFSMVATSSALEKKYRKPEKKKPRRVIAKEEEDARISKLDKAAELGAFDDFDLGGAKPEKKEAGSEKKEAVTGENPETEAAEKKDGEPEKKQFTGKTMKLRLEELLKEEDEKEEELLKSADDEEKVSRRSRTGKIDLDLDDEEDPTPKKRQVRRGSVTYDIPAYQEPKPVKKKKKPDLRMDEFDDFDDLDDLDFELEPEKTAGKPAAVVKEAKETAEEPVKDDAKEEAREAIKKTLPKMPIPKTPVPKAATGKTPAAKAPVRTAPKPVPVIDEDDETGEEEDMPIRRSSAKAAEEEDMPIRRSSAKAPARREAKQAPKKDAKAEAVMNSLLDSMAEDDEDDDEDEDDLPLFRRKSSKDKEAPEKNASRGGLISKLKGAFVFDDEDDEEDDEDDEEIAEKPVEKPVRKAAKSAASEEKPKRAAQPERITRKAKKTSADELLPEDTVTYGKNAKTGVLPDMGMLGLDYEDFDDL